MTAVTTETFIRYDLTTHLFAAYAYGVIIGAAPNWAEADDLLTAYLAERKAVRG